MGSVVVVSPRAGKLPGLEMLAIGGTQVLSRVRFFLVFLILALTTFEWQYIVSQRFGNETGGSRLGLAFSIGTLSTVLLLAGLAYFGRSLTITKIPLTLLLFNSILSLLVVVSLNRFPWLAGWIFVIAAIHASLNLVSLSIEVSAVQLVSELRYPRVRIFGSLGYLLAAFVSQAWPGVLFPVIILLALAALLTPMLPARKSAPVAEPVHLKNSKVQALIWFCLTAFVLWSVSRGFEILGPIYLRSATSHGLMWLSVLIISESVLLQFVDRFESRIVIVVAAAMWAVVYGLFAYNLSPMTVCLALMLAGFNCPAQVMLQSQVGQRFPGVPSAQAALSIAGAAGGFTASLFYAWLAEQAQGGVLPICIIVSLVAIPLLWLFVNSVKPEPEEGSVDGDGI